MLQTDRQKNTIARLVQNRGSSTRAQHKRFLLQVLFNRAAPGESPGLCLRHQVKRRLSTARTTSVHADELSFSTQHLSCTKHDLRSSVGCTAMSCATANTKPFWKWHQVLRDACWSASAPADSLCGCKCEWIRLGVGSSPEQDAHTKPHTF